MKTKGPWGKPTFVISTGFSFFSRCNMLTTSFLLESLMMTLFGPALDFKQWQASIFAGSIGMSHLLKIFKTQSSKPSSLIDSGIPAISRHSGPECYSFAQHFLSTKISCWVSLSLDFSTNIVCRWTFRLISRSDSNIRKFVFSSFSSSFIADKVESNLSL